MVMIHEYENEAEGRINSAHYANVQDPEQVATHSEWDNGIYENDGLPSNAGIATTPESKPLKQRKKLSKIEIGLLLSTILNFFLAATAITLFIQLENKITEQRKITEVQEREVQRQHGMIQRLEGILQEEYSDRKKKRLKLETERNKTGIKLNSRIGAVEISLNQWKQRVSSLEEKTTWYHASNGYFYKVFENPLSYVDANISCQEKGGRLVTDGVRNPEMRAEIKRLMKTKNEDVWIGVNDIEQEDRWVWEDGINGDIEWYKPNQPDNSNGIEDCGHYRPRYNWQVNDDPCNKKHMYMCERIK